MKRRAMSVAAAAAMCGFALNAQAAWTYADGKITDENGWTFQAEEVDGGLKVLRMEEQGSKTDLDLDTPVSDAHGNVWPIVAIAGNDPYWAPPFEGNKGKWTSIRLPATLTTVGTWAFGNNKAVITLPESARVTTMRSGAFIRSGLTGKVVLENMASLSANDQGGVFAESQLQDVELGKDVTVVPAGLLKSCRALTNFVSRASSLTVTSWSMENCTALKEYSFSCYPTLSASWNSGAKTGTGVRIFAPETSSEWQSVIRRTTFTAWADSDKKDDYFAAFGADAAPPLGYTTEPFKAWLLWMPRAAGASLTVVGDPDNYGVVEPDYGVHDGLESGIVRCKAPRYAASADGTRLMECVGWESFALEGEEWKRKSGGAGLEFDYPLAADDIDRLSWLWQAAGYDVSLDEGKLPSGTSAVANVPRNLEGYYAVGTTVSFTASGSGFLGWRGVPEDATFDGATVTFAVRDARSVYPVFKCAWTYADGKITNGDWTFNVTLENESELTLKKASVKGKGPILFFDAPIADANGKAYSLVAVAASPSSPFENEKSMEEVLLPSSLQSVALWAFAHCPAKITIPERNALKTIGRCAFFRSGFAGKLRLRGDVWLESHDYAGQGMFYESDLRDLDLGKEITVVPLGFLKGCRALTNFVSRAPSLTVTSWSMENCTALKEYRFACYPALSNKWNNGAKTGTGVRVFAPRGNAEWRAAMAADTFTPWAGCPAKDTDAYFAAFGAGAEVPKGYMTAPFAAWLLEYSLGSGLAIHVR